jgi:hypothetical protein
MSLLISDSGLVEVGCVSNGSSDSPATIHVNNEHKALQFSDDSTGSSREFVGLKVGILRFSCVVFSGYSQALNIDNMSKY